MADTRVKFYYRRARSFYAPARFHQVRGIMAFIANLRSSGIVKPNFYREMQIFFAVGAVLENSLWNL